MGFLRFLQYNNAVPIALSIMLLGAGSIFAATNPEVIYSTQEAVLSIDNTYIANKNFSAYTPSVQITDVAEDNEYYYITYNFTTIDLQDYVWKDVVKTQQVMRVSKADLGPYRDLGLYVTNQLKQLVDRELARLKETQEIEKRNVSRKVVATAYSGLVGAFLNDKTDELPGYIPVIKPPEPVVVAPPVEQPPVQTPPSQQSTSTPATSGDTTSPTLQVLGSNPARVALGATYNDLGAAATDNSNENLVVIVRVNGTIVSVVGIDTTKVGNSSIRYESTDSAGNTGYAERIVEVYDPATQSTGGSGTASTTPATTTPPVSSGGGSAATTTTPTQTETATTTTQSPTPIPPVEKPTISPEESPPESSPLVEPTAPPESATDVEATSAEVPPAETPAPVENTQPAE